MRISTSRIVAFIASLGIIAIAAYIVMQPKKAPPIGDYVPTEPAMVTYATSSLSFAYPETYVREERDAPGSGLRKRHTIVLMESDAAAHIPEGGEGPTSITIDAFQNNLDRQTVEAWIRNTSLSNFKLSTDEALTPTTIGGRDGYSYTWDGLYRGESHVVSAGDDIYMFTVTWMSADDRIRQDFKELLQSVRFR